MENQPKKYIISFSHVQKEIGRIISFDKTPKIGEIILGERITKEYNDYGMQQFETNGRTFREVGLD